MIEWWKKSWDYDVEKFYWASYVVDLTKNNNLIEKISDVDLNNKILLIKSPKNDNNKDYFYLSIKEVEFLISKKIKNIWIDTLSIDWFWNTDFQNHKAFFSKDIIIYEWLDLKNVTEWLYNFFWLPLNFDNLEAGLTRPFLIPN
jgi:kynurenine formamidase